MIKKKYVNLTHPNLVTVGRPLLPVFLELSLVLLSLKRLPGRGVSLLINTLLPDVAFVEENDGFIVEGYVLKLRGLFVEGPLIPGLEDIENISFSLVVD